MPRLSIVLPALRSIPLLESSLASVLQHRPADAEVILVHTEPYDDPYALADELTFVSAPPGASLADCLNLGVAQAAGEIVHVLQLGTEVTDGWCEAPLAHFADPNVASVAALILDLDRPQRALSTGVTYRAGGSMRLRSAGKSERQARSAAAEVLGPALTAGFYRRAIWDALGGLCAKVGDLADVDLALQLEAIGATAVYEPRCVVYAPPAARPSAFQRARQAERLFRRHLAQRGGWRAWTGHSWTVACEFLANLPRLTMFNGLAGRLCSWCESAGQDQLGRQLHEARQLLLSDSGHDEPVTVRFDPRHRAGPRSPHLAPAYLKAAG